MKYTSANSSIPTSYFSNEVLVVCPKCGGEGIVSTKLGKHIVPKPYQTVSSFVCRDCLFENVVEKKFLGIAQGFREKACQNCMTTISITTEPTEETYNFIDVKCPNCHQVNHIWLYWYRYRDNRTIDPFLGYQLLLQTHIKSHVLWFYNFEHLEYVRDYVSTKLREDNFRQKYSLISNLPKFIIEAKNREIVISKINKLEQEFRKK